MISTYTVYKFGQTVLDSSSKPKIKKIQTEAKDPEENQIIEEYEGECELCEPQRPQKACAICGPD